MFIKIVEVRIIEIEQFYCEICKKKCIKYFCYTLYIFKMIIIEMNKQERIKL